MEAEDDVITAGEALFMFRDLRQEVTVLAQLDHPYIVSLLGWPGGWCGCVFVVFLCYLIHSMLLQSKHVIFLLLCFLLLTFL